MPFPRRITSASLAAFVGWRVERVTRALKAMGIAKKDWCGKSLAVWCAPEDLAMAWPEMYEVLLENIENIPDVPSKRGGYRPRKNKPNKQDGSHSAVTIHDNTAPVYDYDAHPCSYELGGGWSCAPGCDNPDHKI